MGVLIADSVFLNYITPVENEKVTYLQLIRSSASECTKPGNLLINI